MENERERGITIHIGHIGLVGLGASGSIERALISELSRLDKEVILISPQEAKKQLPPALEPPPIQFDIKPVHEFFDGRSPRQKRRDEIKKAKKKKR